MTRLCPKGTSTLIAFFISVIAGVAILLADTGDPSVQPKPAFFLSNQSLTSVSIKTTTGQSAVNHWVLNHAAVQHLYDSKYLEGTARFLVSLIGSGRGNRGYAQGRDLVFLDEKGRSTTLARDVLLARFSPDGSRIAYTDSLKNLHVIRDDGLPITSIARAYDPSWSPDGKAIAFTQTPEKALDSELLHISTLNLDTGERSELTKGQTDFFPVYHPSGAWLIFVSSSRTGLASLWAVSTSGGDARQLTNIGSRRVDDTFIPTPYRTAAWSPNGSFFAYDRVDDIDSPVVWSLRINPISREVISAELIGEGLFPQWVDEGSVAVSNKGSISVLEATK